MKPNSPAEDERKPPVDQVQPSGPPACPVCGGRLIEVRAKLQCSRCRTTYETCCEGGRG